ncbi:MAG: helix-turn-helix transcriptional regulator [Leptolinea sp.]
METKSQVKTLRAHKLAALITDGRLYARRTPEEACALLGWEPYHLQLLETASITPSLPELEALAAIYAVPVDHFFGSKSLSDEMPKLRVETMNKRLQLRQRILGAMIMQARSRQKQSREDLALITDLSINLLTQYELGETPIPLTDLEDITRALQIDMTSWIDSYAIPTRETLVKTVTPVVQEISGEKNSFRLPKDLSDFVASPVNKQYLVIASKLSTLPADQLRKIAESLLEITY